MAEIGNPYARGKQILTTLHEHGALSTRGLSKLLYPRITKCGARQALSILKNKGLVVQRFDSLPQNCGNYFQLSLREETRPIISKMINVHVAHLEEHAIRDQELYHSEECAIWCARFRRMFPEATVLREFQYVKDEKFRRILLIDYDDYGLKPDIMMHFPKHDTDASTTIAIEVERSRKANIRLVEKLRKLSTQSLLDGVIYFCSTTSILETIRQLYENKVRSKALRIQHYGNNFFLFSNGATSANYDGPLMLNSELKPIQIFDWVRFLISNPNNKRREANLKLSSNA